MARVNSGEVREILEDNIQIETRHIDVFIVAANDLVTNAMVNSSLGAVTLKEIEKYITAHLICMTKNRQATDEEVDDIRIKYAGTFGELLKSTTYGQIALTLDTSGQLSRVGKREAVFKAIESFD